MITPVIPTYFVKAMMSIDNGLFVIWDEYLERFQIMHREPRTGLVRCIVMVEEEDGSFRNCDYRTLDYLKNQVSWETMRRYPRPEEMGRVLREKQAKQKLEREEERNYTRKMWNKEHKKYWKEALDNAARGIHSLPSRIKETITVTAGLSPKHSTGKKELGLFDN